MTLNMSASKQEIFYSYAKLSNSLAFRKIENLDTLASRCSPFEK